MISKVERRGGLELVMIYSLLISQHNTNTEAQTYVLRANNKPHNHHKHRSNCIYRFGFWVLGFGVNAVDLDLPESSNPFSKSCQRPAEAPWMARRALPHRMCDQRVLLMR